MEIEYIVELKDQRKLYDLYESVGWNDILKLTEEQLCEAMNKSYYIIYAYFNNELIGTGRIVSDGIINSYLCGGCVNPHYRNRGIAREIVKMLVEKCKDKNLKVQLFCKDELVSYYEKIGFINSSIGMKVK